MTASQFDIDAALVRKLAGLLDETRLTEIEYSWGEHSLRIARQPAPVQAVAGVAAAPAVAAAPGAAAPGTDLASHPGAVKSPMVGTAYMAAQPGAPAFIKIGDTVASGQPLLIIEAMKVMNQIRAPKGGRVAQILVDNSSPVEFGQVLVVLE